MNKIVKAFLLAIFFISFNTVTHASDFKWMEKLNVQASADSSGFKVKLGSRFNIDDAQVNNVLNQVNNHAHTYMVFRLGEMTQRPVKDVVSVYHEHKQKGWGFMAKNLGIKPGSRQFYALKGGHDLDKAHAQKKDKGKNKAKGKSKGK